jgi:putative transposase
MPRKARIDTTGAVHHIIVRGIARQKIFDDDSDRDFFVERLGQVLSATQTQCFAWALIPNHFHLLLKTGGTSISTVMRRLLTGYAIHYNRRHHRYGHLFQNRYKSILCEEDSYLLELVRYIHLNPIRAKLAVDIRALYDYCYSGHSVIMGKTVAEWQDATYVLRLFGKRISAARKKYNEFVEEGIDLGKREDLIGGGLIRSAGGWSGVKSLRKSGMFQKSDERILGAGGFVEEVLSQTSEAFNRKYFLRAKGVDVARLAERVAEVTGTPLDNVLAAGKHPETVFGRSLLCYWATSELGVTQAALSRQLGISQAAVSLSVTRGRRIAADKKFEIGNL